MQIKLFQDLKKFALTSTIAKEDFELVKKYRPSALKKQDEDGNDVFAVSYVEGRPCIAPCGITFGSVSQDGFLMIVGDLPADLTDATKRAEYVADKVGAALVFINEFEEALPVVVDEITADRNHLMNTIEIA